MNTDQPELIPLRALNQVSYCPRLYYLEYVESVMPINEYVEDGLFQHRRVNDPALANRERQRGRRRASAAFPYHPNVWESRASSICSKNRRASPVLSRPSDQPLPGTKQANLHSTKTTPFNFARRASWSRKARVCQSRRE